MKEYFKFKHPLKINDLRMIKPSLLKILAFVIDYSCEKKLSCVITSVIRTKEENQMLGSKSLTHVEGRAFDLSVKGWSIDEIDDIMAEVSKEFNKVGALNSDGESRPVIFHNNGNGDHLHFQVRA
jgi:uncharacterized protein YcbK (DUF882 family)